MYRWKWATTCSVSGDEGRRRRAFYDTSLLLLPVAFSACLPSGEGLRGANGERLRGDTGRLSSPFAAALVGLLDDDAAATREDGRCSGSSRTKEWPLRALIVESGRSLGTER